MDGRTKLAIDLPQFQGTLARFLLTTASTPTTATTTQLLLLPKFEGDQAGHPGVHTIGQDRRAQSECSHHQLSFFGFTFHLFMSSARVMIRYPGLKEFSNFILIKQKLSPILLAPLNYVGYSKK